MRRRSFLQSGGAALCVSLSPVVGSTSAGVDGKSDSIDRLEPSTLPESASGSDPYEPLGTVDVPGARDAAVHHDGEVAYVAATSGFVAVDISDPATPEILAERRDIETNTDTNLGEIWDVWPAGDRLVVAGPANFNRSLPDGFALFDISNPADPEQVAFHPTDHYIHNTYFTDNVVYLTGRIDNDTPVVMVDVSDDDPEEVARWSLVDHDERWADIPVISRLLHDVYVQDGIAYLLYWDAGTWLVDVSDPADPTVRSWVSDYELDELAGLTLEEARVVARAPPGNHHYGQVSEDGSLLAVGKETWAVEDSPGVLGEEDTLVGGPGGIDLYDVSDPENPEFCASIGAPESFDQTTSGWFTTAHNFDIVDDRLYASWYFGGVAVYDVSDPGTPEQLAGWRDPREASFWTAQSAIPGETFVASSADLSTVFSSLNETRGALYVFPDRPGMQADPPDLTEWPEDVFGPAPADWNDTTQEENDEMASGNDDTEPGGGSEDPDDTDDPDSAESADDDGPGFGVPGALTAVGGVAYLLRKRTQRETPAFTSHGGDE